MNNDFSELRKNYKKKLLSKKDIPSNPIQLFHHWFQNEKSMIKNNNYKDKKEINAMSLSTIGKDGSPETRIVLLKEYSNQGFVFYTNYFSSKGRSIQKFPKVCLSFFWEETERQVIIKGITSKIQKSKSDQYFLSRPFYHQIGCWSSHQSSIILNRNVLENKFKKWIIFFQKKKIDRPFYWGGYIVNPYKIEFWQGQPNRLHDRFIFEIQEDKKWMIYQLSP